MCHKSPTWKETRFITPYQLCLFISHPCSHFPSPSPQVTANRKLGKGEKRGRSGGGSEPALVRSSVQLLPMKAELTPHLARSAKYYLWREWMWTFPNQPTYPNNKYLPQWSPGVQKNKWVFRVEEFPFIPQYALTEGSTMGKLCPWTPASFYP